MFVRVKSTPNSPRRSVQICESRRRGKQISQTIVRHIGIAENEEEEKELRRLAETIRLRMEQERSANLPLFPPEELLSDGPKRPGRKRGKTPVAVEDVRLADVKEETRVVEGIQEVLGRLYDDLGFNKILPKGNDVLKATVLARAANPASKHRTAAMLEEDFGISLPLDRIYRMMDTLHENREKVLETVFEKTRELFPDKIDVLFFDVTTLYFESVTEDELRDFGYSKDQKFHQVQVVLALATTDRGLPVGYRLFPGSTGEVNTLLTCLEDWRKKLPIGRVVLVADRAMLSIRNIQAMKDAGMEFIVGAKLRRMDKETQEEILSESGYRAAEVEGEIMWVNEHEADGDRLITSYSPRRAAKDASDRDRILEKLRKKLSNGRMKNLISNRGYLKYVIADGRSKAALDKERIAADAAWDGMHGVLTNSSLDRLEVLRIYRRLWTVEEAFRISKHDLKMRPIFHFKPERIEAHVAICFLAYALLRHAQYRVSLQQIPVSVDQLRNELLRVQASYLRHKQGGLYRVPSAMTQAAIDIYKAFGLKRSLTPSAVNPTINPA